MTKVALRGCTTYDESELKSSMHSLIYDLGGLESYFQPGERILLKVNLLMKKTPEEATTTHPAVVKVFAEMLRDYGCQVVIGDSPGGPFDLKSLQNIYKGCGYTDILSDGITLNQNVESMEVQFSDGLLLKRMNVIQVLSQVDHVVSFSKLKTHGMMRFTGAVKNMFGIVPGLTKAEYHFKMPKIEDFANMLVDLCEYAAPTLSIMDGIVGMEGAGPSAGNPRDIGVLLGSDNPHVLDWTACKIAGIDMMSVPTLVGAKLRGLLDDPLKEAVFLGAPYTDFLQEAFIVPDIKSADFFEKLPAWMRPPLEKMLKPKPVFNLETCVGCGECARLCPPQTIEMIGKKPVVHLEACIRCYCCQELCPKKAVDIHRPLLLRMMTKL